jgi:hypothetical protein
VIGKEGGFVFLSDDTRPRQITFWVNFIQMQLPDVLRSNLGNRCSGKTFISYRREDSAASPRRLFDRLSNHFPSNQFSWMAKCQ